MVDRNAGKVKTYVDSTTSGVLTDDPIDVSDNLDGIDNFLLAGRFDGNAPADRNLDGDFAAFHVFNHAMTLCDAQDWVDYVDRGYVNQGSPANLDYLANVSSATPSDGQALVYNGSTSQWQPGPVYLEGTVTANVTSNVRTHPDSLINLEPVNTDSMTFQYIRIGNHVEMIGHIVFNATAGDEQYGYFVLEIPNAPSWLRFPDWVSSDETNQTNRPAHCSFQSIKNGNENFNANYSGALSTTSVTGSTVTMKIAWAISVGSTTDDVGVTMKISWFLPS